MPTDSRKKGFSLIELLVTMVIFGLLSFGTMGLYRTQRSRASDAVRKADISRIKEALYEHYFDKGCFPATLPNCGNPLPGDNANYLDPIPCAPSGENYVYEVEGGSCGKWFKVLTDLVLTSDPTIDEVGCRFGCGDGCVYNYGVSSTNVRVEDDCINYYVCAPGGACESFIDPEKSGCPKKFINDGSCGNVDCGDKDNRCQNSSGKYVPE